MGYTPPTSRVDSTPSSPSESAPGARYTTIDLPGRLGSPEKESEQPRHEVSSDAATKFPVIPGTRWARARITSDASPPFPRITAKSRPDLSTRRFEPSLAFAVLIDRMLEQNLYSGSRRSLLQMKTFDAPESSSESSLRTPAAPPLPPFTTSATGPTGHSEDRLLGQLLL